MIDLLDGQNIIFSTNVVMGLLKTQISGTSCFFLLITQ